MSRLNRKPFTYFSDTKLVLISEISVKMNPLADLRSYKKQK